MREFSHLPSQENSVSCPGGNGKGAEKTSLAEIAAHEIGEIKTKV